MTPFAARLVRELTMKPRKRLFIDRLSMLDAMRDSHCFDCTEVLPLATQTHDQIAKGLDQEKLDDMSEQTSFLPAPKTWIEFGDGAGGTIGFLLEERPAEKVAYVRGAVESQGTCVAFGPSLLGLRATGSRRGFAVPAGTPENLEEWQHSMSVLLTIMLAFINTPRVIGRQQHMPLAALERRLLKHRRAIGYYPLNAWTEIKLKITPTLDLSDEAPAEAHLTGHKALHFCRAHLRIRLGRVELVRSHWRGDPSIGTKLSRYKLESGAPS